VRGFLAAWAWLFAFASGEDACLSADQTSLLQADMHVARALVNEKLSASTPQSPVSILNAAPSASERLELLKPVFWLHIPKTGTSWANVMLLYPGFCPLLPEDYVAEDLMSFLAQQVSSLPTYCPNAVSEHWDVFHKPLGGIYSAVKGHVVSLFRQPEQRIISSYWQEVLFFGSFTEEEVSVIDYARQFAGYQFKFILSSAKFSGIEGKGMLMETSTNTPPPSPANIALALQHLREGFAFVGLTEEWDLSVCLFHAKFGAKCSVEDFLDVHPGIVRNSTSDLYDTTGLHGWVDATDREIYQEATRIYKADMQRFGVTSESCAQWCWPGAQATSGGEASAIGA
jgi:hypothetical protein